VNVLSIDKFYCNNSYKWCSEVIDRLFFMGYTPFDIEDLKVETEGGFPKP
jgi:hypothetical protein